MRHTFSILLATLILFIMIQTNHLNANEADPDPGAGQSDLTSHLPFQPLTPKDIERFHGHLGPNVLFGVRMGEHACGVLGFPQHFGLTVSVECLDGPPHTCLIDGLQLSTGATMGKENISHISAQQVRVTIKEDASGRMVSYRLKDSTKAQIKKWQADKVSLQDQSMHIYEMKPEDLFEIEVTPAAQNK